VSSVQFDANFDGPRRIGDGTRAFFDTPQRMTADDTASTNFADVFMRAGGVTTKVSKPAAGRTDPDLGDSFLGDFTRCGQAYVQTPEQLTAEDADGGGEDVYQTLPGDTTLVSKPAAGTTDPSGADIDVEQVSDTGSRVYLSTTAKLTGDDTDLIRRDVYLHAGGASPRTGPGSTSTPTSAWSPRTTTT
jgi:hypothetical protein